MTNTEIVKGMFEAFNRGAIEHVLNGLADNVEWVVPGPNTIPFAGRYRGRDGVTGFFTKLAAATELDPVQIGQYVEQGDIVVALGNYEGRTKELQKPLKTNFAMAFTLSGGKVTRFQEYIDTAAIASAYIAEGQAARG